MSFYFNAEIIIALWNGKFCLPKALQFFPNKSFSGVIS